MKSKNEIRLRDLETRLYSCDECQGAGPSVITIRRTGEAPPGPDPVCPKCHAPGRWISVLLVGVGDPLPSETTAPDPAAPLGPWGRA